MLYQLKRAGINQGDLIGIYVTVIIQNRYLKTIFPGYPYENILQIVVTTN